MLSEKALVSAALTGDPRALRQLVEEHSRLVFAMVSRLVRDPAEQEDLCQEIFIKVHKSLPKFKFQSRLSTWIARIAYLSAINELKRQQRRFEETYPKELADIPSPVENPEELLTRKEIAVYLNFLVSQLPPECQTVVNLYYMNEFSLAEIQEITGIPEGTVKSYLFRARQLLKGKIKRYLKQNTV